MIIIILIIIGNKIRKMGEIGVLCNLCELRKIYDKRRETSKKLGKNRNFRKYIKPYKF